MRQAELLAVVQTGLAVSAAPETEITVVASRKQALRYTATQIIQNLETDDWAVWFRVVDQGRIGIAETNQRTEAALQKAAAQAWISAQAQTRAEPYQLPVPQGNFSEIFSDGNRMDEQPEEKLASSFELLNQSGWQGAGNLTAEVLEMGIGNSKGICSYHAESRDSFTCIAALSGGGSSGYGGCWGNIITREDVQRITAEAMDWASLDSRRMELGPGEYEVVLSPYATADLIWLLQYMGFSARAVLEECSFLIGRFDQPLVAESISLWDDAGDRRGLRWSFDWEGVPRQKVCFIERGMARKVVSDSWTAGKLGRLSTGHAIPTRLFDRGPYPAHLVMEPGNASPEELVKQVEEGIYINRFHYTNVVDPRRALATGMTRDGTYYIHKGQIRGRIPNLRFSDSLLRALGKQVVVGNDLRLIHDGDTGILAPSLKLGRLRFTS